MPKKPPKYYIRKDGLHEAIRIINGKRKAFRGRTDAEVEQKMIAYQGEVERGRLFKDAADEWKEQHYKTLSPTTAHGYEASFKRANSQFGDMPIKDISPSDIDRYLRQMGQGKFGKKTVTTMLLVLNLIFTRAVVAGDVTLNPCAAVFVPKGLTQTKRELPSDKDIQAVKNSIQNKDSWLLPYFILYTGCRRGEALALTYGDVDREEKIIRINKAVHFECNRPKLKLPKTKSGIREIILLDKLAAILPHRQAEELIFPGPNGKYLDQSKYAQMWKKWQEPNATTVTAHQLRHGYATMLFEAGIDEKDAQDLLGHASIAMTRDVYTHIRKKRKHETADKLNKAAETF